MSYSSLANNQTISFNNLQDGVTTGQLSQKAPIPVSNEQITKAEANTYINIDTSFAPYAAKASNQLVVKSNLESIATVVGTVDLEWWGIANNQTTSSPIQLLAGNSNLGGGRISRSTDFGFNYSNVLVISDGLRSVKFMPAFRHASYLSVPPFLAVGRNGRIVTNSVTNCSSWVTISSPTTRDLLGIAFNNSGVGIIVGDGRILKTNTNNRINSWSIVNSVSAVWQSVASNGSTFVAVGINNAIITGDSSGTVWTQRSMPPSFNRSVFLTGVTYHTDGYFYAVGDMALEPYLMRSSDSGANWETYFPNNDLFFNGLYSIESINGRLVLGGPNFQYQIINNVLTRYPARLDTVWVSIVKDANSNGFDMASAYGTFISLGAYSNF